MSVNKILSNVVKSLLLIYRMARKGSSAGDDEASKTEPSGTSAHQGPNRGL